MDAYWQDLKFAARRLTAAPAFVVVAVLTLALGIGANIAIFTVVNAVLIRPLPFAQPDRLVRIHVDANGTGARSIGISQPELQDLKQSAEVFDKVSALWPVSASLLGGDRPERIEVMVTSADYFQLLGAGAAMGRVYGPGDAVAGFSDPVVVSDGLWRRLFGAAPDIIGRKVVMDTDTYTIVGVMPPDFRHPGETVQGAVDMWSACGFAAAPFPSTPQRAQNFIPASMGRLRPGISIEQAQSKLDALAARLQATYPKNYPVDVRWGLRIQPVQQGLTAQARPVLSVLMTAVA